MLEFFQNITKKEALSKLESGAGKVLSEGEINPYAFL